jgi:ribosomal protein L7/L12
LGAPVQVVSAPAKKTLSESAMARVQDEIRLNRLIPAIKIIREETGMGLKDAKDLAEDLRRRMV